MIDISSATSTGLGTFDTQTTKAANILSVQLGALEYAQDLGIDLEYFLSEEFRFQNASFQAYLIEVLANNGINVASLLDSEEDLFTNYIFNLQPAESGGGLIAR